MTTRVGVSEAEHSRKSVVVWRWLSSIILLILILSVVATGAYLLLVNVALGQRLAVLNEERDDAIANAQALYEQLIDAGQDPVVRPTEGVSGPAGPQGAQGEQGAEGRAPTLFEIVTAVRSVCSNSMLCVGPPGQDGADGVNGQNGAAGADGANGTNGANGADGATGPPGPAGPAGADSTVPGPEGPAGPPGPAGEPGAPGPACPEGYSVREAWILMMDDPASEPSLQPVAICWRQAS